MALHRPRLIGITVLTLASGWLGVGVNRLLGEPDSIESPASLIWITLPLLFVLGARMLGMTTSPGCWRPRFREAWPMYAVAAFAFPSVTAASTLLGRITGAIDLGAFNPEMLAKTVSAALAVGLVKNVFEESVWRGYFVGELDARKLPDWAVYLGAGLVWALWHLPYYLVLLPESDMRTIIDVPREAFAAIAVAVMAAWSVLFTEMYRIAGSIWPLVLLHAVEDAVVNPLAIDGHLAIKPGFAGLFSPVVGVVPAAGYLSLGLGLRQWRRRRERRGAASTRARRLALAA